MAYLARHASGCHYECYFGDVVAALEKKPKQFSLYKEGKNYSNDFIVLIAAPNKIDEIVEQFDWRHVTDELEMAPFDEGDNRQVKRAGYGFTGGICNAFDVAVNAIGEAEPRKREGTYKEKVIRHFETIASVTSDIHVPWLQATSSKLWHDDRFPSRTKQYASQISANTRTESLYYGLTYGEHLLSCHVDAKNPHHSLKAISPVFAIANRCPKTTHRKVIISTMRKAICDVLLKVDRLSPLVNAIMLWIESLPS